MTRPHGELADLTLPTPHRDVLERLARAVRDAEECRWLTLGCSLGRGNGDEYSDIDAGIGYAEPLAIEDLERVGSEVVARSGKLVDLLVHRMDGWPNESRRFAAEYANGVQLDLVLFPARWRPGPVEGEEVVIVDKDAAMTQAVVSGSAGPPSASLAREWVMLGWWAVSDIAKYLRRGSLFEAAARIETAREMSLRLAAVAGGVPFPGFGLTSLLDYPPFSLPDNLAATYCNPADAESVTRAATHVAALLVEFTDRAAAVLDSDLSTAWAATSMERLTNATAACDARPR